MSNVQHKTMPVHQAAESEPIVLEIVKGAIRSAQSEMTALLDRTSMSPFIREKKDYFIGFFDSSGALIHSASLPLMGDMIKPLLERFPMTAMREGDIYWYNDCYGSKGAVSHTPDQVLVAPVIVDGKVRAFSLSWAHFNDIGGLRPGTLSSLAESIFHEGTIVPAVRLYAAGELNEDLVAMFAANSRYPAMVHGDLRALGAAVRLGARRMIELYSRYGVLAVDGALERSKQQTAALTRKRIACTWVKSSSGFPASARKLASYPSSNRAILRPGKIAVGVASHHSFRSVRLSKGSSILRFITSANDVSA